MNSYRHHILKLIKQALHHAQLPASPRFLDFGAGDGWFASKIRDELVRDADVHAIDVKKRDFTHCDINIVSPSAIRDFPAQSFDLVYSIDVLHHCADPEETLHGLIRASSDYVLLKDHVAFSGLDAFTLGVLDEIGNRRFGIPSNYHYQRNWAWENILQRAGWDTVFKAWPAPCHRGILGKLTNRLQYVAMYRSPKAAKHQITLQDEVDRQH